MGLRIQTNATSLMAQRNVRTNNEMETRSEEKLASGYRINRAADDAAGLFIAERVRADIRSNRQGVRNGNDAISIIQTSEGGLVESANMLTRMRELAIEAATDTLTDVDRSLLDKEAQQLKQELGRMAETTQYDQRI